MKLNNFPNYVQEFYAKVKEDAGGGAYGSRVAWNAVKSRLHETENTIIAQAKDFVPQSMYTFTVKQEKTEVITQSEDGDYILDIILATDQKNKNGKYFTEQDLKEMASYINENGLAAPGEDNHSEFERVALTEGLDTRRIRKRLQDMRGEIKNVKAAVKDGKLWVQGRLDKSFKTKADAYENVSIEILGRTDANNRMSGTPVSFIFTDKPMQNGTAIASE